MTLKNTFVYLLVSLSCVSYAQLKDSIKVKSNPFYENYFTDLIENPLLYGQFKIEDFTATHIEYQYKNQNFKRRQTAKHINDITFKTQGIYNYSKNLRVFGDFNVSKSYEDDLGFNLSSQRTDHRMILSPNYYYAPKAGNWDNQRYALMGGVNYQFNNGIALGTVIHYKNEKLYRKLDPRPEILVHDINGKAFLGYTLNNKHTLEAFVGLGKNTEASTIIYLDDLNNSPTKEDQFVRFNSGYGYTSINNSSDKFMHRGITKTTGAGYQLKLEKQALSVNYSYNKLIENLYQKTRFTDGTTDVLQKKSAITHKYRSINHIVKANYIFNGDKVNYFANAKYQFAKNDNFSVISQGQNFRYVENRFNFDNGLIKSENGKTLYAITLGATYSRNVIQDLLAVVDKRVNYLEIYLKANTDLYKKGRNRINTEIFATNYNALNSSLNYQVSGSNTAFANQVIYNDHGYDVTSKLTTGINVNYDIKLKKSFFRIYANYQSLFATGTQYKQYTTNLVNKPNEQATVGLAIIY
jgi:hypothetical protein